MRNFKILIYRYFLRYGFDFRKFLNAFSHSGWYNKNYNEIIAQAGKSKTWKIVKNYPILNERDSSAGLLDGHYFNQDLYVAQHVFRRNPTKHIDIGSRIDGFVAHVASFRKIYVYDIRELGSSIMNIEFVKADLMVPVNISEKIDSISSLHAIEHFGLGRYGDPIDFYGYLKAIKNISDMLCSQGFFYFSVPIGDQRIEFNAHRIFSLDYIMEILDPYFELEEFSYIDDNGKFHGAVNLNDQIINKNFGCKYGTGIFILKRR
jgi:hypothetical protein